jgi:hypothetical protein
MKLCLLDMLLNYYTWTNVNKTWKSRGSSRQVPKIVFDEYIRCYTKKTIIGSRRDYCAGATIDFEMDAAFCHRLLNAI